MTIKVTTKERSYGVIPIHAINKTFLLVRGKTGHWGAPKGHPNPGESELETARREFTEETGINEVQIIDDTVFTEQYCFEQNGAIIEKTVKYFLAEVPEAQIIVDSKEILECKWFNYDEALSMVIHEGRKRIIREAKEYADKHFEKTL